MATHCTTTLDNAPFYPLSKKTSDWGLGVSHLVHDPSHILELAADAVWPVQKYARDVLSTINKASSTWLPWIWQSHADISTMNPSTNELSIPAKLVTSEWLFLFARVMWTWHHESWCATTIRLRNQLEEASHMWEQERKFSGNLASPHHVWHQRRGKHRDTTRRGQLDQSPLDGCENIQAR